MESLLFTIVSFILAIGILITVHEFGHFWVARRLGVKVLRFSVGFGTPIWKRIGRIDATEYVVAAIPLGGYVKMLDEREGEVAERELGRAFNRQSLRTRTAIVLAGPVANFLFAILAFWLIMVSGESGSRPWVGAVAEGSVAEDAGFQTEDELLAIADRKITSWEAAVYALLREGIEGRDLSVQVLDRDGYPQVRVLAGEKLAALSDRGNVLEGLGLTPKRPNVPPLLGEIVPGESADLAGLKPADLVLSIDADPVESWSQLVAVIRNSPGKPVLLEVERDGQRLELQLLVGTVEADGKRVGRIGAGVDIPEGLYDEYRSEFRLGPVEAIGASLYKTWDMSLFMLRMLGRMVVGKASVENLSGPISIAQTAGKTASYGVIYFLKFLALVSISLGVLNLLPVPMLDGGHLLYFLVEALKGGPLSEEFQIQGQRIGMAVLLAVMLLAFYIDITRLLG
ncbi:MAG: RIP metalloprotease RseP [Gammaproteobacteria bacterium]|nr:RIP metalloprotease RseP [Gammaproteobacteria bacterium]MCP5416553.1 RIP metalloprotease RseP [Chromatiaceae bacterium]